jgi:Protein kinase domain
VAYFSEEKKINCQFSHSHNFKMNSTEWLLPLTINDDLLLGAYEVIHNEKVVWTSLSPNINTKCPDGEKLEEEANKLLDENGNIDGNALVELVNKSGGDKEYARFLANVTNLYRPPIEISQSEMACQQLVFTPISSIFYCFSPKNYCADSVVYCGPFQYTDKNKAQVCLSNIKPDAAITLTVFGHVALALMELKAGTSKGSEFDIVDKFKCVQWTSISAIGLIMKGISNKICIPFVLNINECASIYTTIVEKNAIGEISLSVSVLGNFTLSVTQERVKCVAFLAVLLSKVKEAVSTKAGRDLNHFIQKCSTSTTPSSTTTIASGSHNSGSSQKRRRKNPNRNRKSAGARQIASAEGEVVNLSSYNFGSTARNESPFYFYGDLSDKSPVFVKVWREGDKNTNVQDIETEIDLLRKANKKGVRCPSVIDHLTAHSLHCHHGRYHRLVMTRLVNDHVKPSDVCAFGRSLIDAVQRLHNSGILHCDLKPSNIVWDANVKLASLIDFGHSQLTRDSTAYVGTEGYTAPEVCQGSEPHSPRSEAYSIGKTLLVISSEGHSDSNQISRVQGVAKKLSCHDPHKRMTLDEADDELRICASPSQKVLPLKVVSPSSVIFQ